MAKFTDTMVISVAAGHGGPGAATFRREKYIAKGGPDGGDGGRGGDVLIEADRRYYNLSHLFKDRIYKAERGEQGMSQNRHGKDGSSLTVLVPPGTQVFDDDTGDLIADLIDEGPGCLVASGGIGGKGNAFFKSATNQTPRFSQPGMEGEEKRIRLNLKLIADVGLVGLPNAGKSTLLSKITRAKPKIADYPFTTLIPNLGVVERNSGRVYKIADIPGIIEGAHRGHGLGLSFLQHIERVKIILYMIDITEDDILYNFELLQSELDMYNANMRSRPSLVVLTKSDLVEPDEAERKMALFHDNGVLALSSVSGFNLESLLSRIDELLESRGATQNAD